VVGRIVVSLVRRLSGGFGILSGTERTGEVSAPATSLRRENLPSVADYLL
jgi:hypothetical protein